MLFKTHFVFSFFVFLMSFHFFENFFLFSLFFLFSILFVDIDSRESKMGRILFFRPIQFFLKHRGIFHSLFFCFSFSVIFYFLMGNSAAFGFFIGFLSHLFLDCLNLKGIMLFWPFSKKRIKGFFVTGGIFEGFIFYIFLLLDLFFVGRVIAKLLF